MALKLLPLGQGTASQVEASRERLSLLFKYSRESPGLGNRRVLVLALPAPSGVRVPSCIEQG